MSTVDNVPTISITPVSRCHAHSSIVTMSRATGHQDNEETHNGSVRTADGCSHCYSILHEIMPIPIHTHYHARLCYLLWSVSVSRVSPGTQYSILASRCEVAALFTLSIPANTTRHRHGRGYTTRALNDPSWSFTATSEGTGSSPSSNASTF